MFVSTQSIESIREKARESIESIEREREYDERDTGRVCRESVERERPKETERHY